MLFGVAFYSAVIGIVSTFFQTSNTKESLLKAKLNQIEEFCTKLKLPDDIQTKLEESLKYSADKLAYLWLSSDEDIFGDFNTSLKYEFLRALHDELITKCHFFKSKDLGFITRIIPRMRPIFFRAGENIWKKDDDAICAYFLTGGEVGFFLDATPTIPQHNFRSGRLRRLSNIGAKPLQNKLELLVRKFAAVTYFGAEEILLRKNRMLRAKAMTDCHMLLLPRFDFEVIIKDEYSYIYQDLLQYSVKRYQSMIEQIREVVRLTNSEGPRGFSIDIDFKDAFNQKVLSKADLSTEKLHEMAQNNYPIEDLLKLVLKEESKEQQQEDVNLEIKTPEFEVLMNELKGKSN